MINFYKNRVCLNVLANSLDNAIAVYEAASKHVLVGVLSANYSSVDEAVNDMKRYSEALEGNMSIGLGGGNPNQDKMVTAIAKRLKVNHINQVFTSVGVTQGTSLNPDAVCNALITPTSNPNKVIISTGPLSSKAEEKAVVNTETALLMIKDSGGNSIKFFPMNGLESIESLKVVAGLAAKHDMIMEPTGGIDLENFKEIMQVILDAGVKKIIPHVYSSIVDKVTKETKVQDIKKLMNILKDLLA